jgi:hypothetical protein
MARYARGFATAVTATLPVVTPRKRQPSSPESEAAKELGRQARQQGVSLTGPDGLLKQLTKTVLETAFNEELTEHLGYDKHDPAGQGVWATSATGEGRRTCCPRRRVMSRSTSPATARARHRSRSSRKTARTAAGRVPTRGEFARGPPAQRRQR